MNKKHFTVLTVFFIAAGIFPSFNVLGLSEFNENTANISGYVTDIDDYPIKDVKISFSCGEEFYECYSNETGYYIKENLPLLYCIWNITVTKTGYQSKTIDMPIGQETSKNFTLYVSEPIKCEIEVTPGWHFPTPQYEITNTGDTSIHNVALTDTIVEGSILYNNRDVAVVDVIEPGDWVHFDSNTWFIGFGTFSIEIIVTCDEGTLTSDTTNGFIIGSLIFIP
jgi:hypothetical protein